MSATPSSRSTPHGNILGLRVNTKANLGAYMSTFSSSIPTYLYATLLAGQYKTPAIYCDVQAYYTNTAPVDAYRGAGRPEASFLLETLMDQAAHELGKDPAEFRRQNFIPKDAFPYQTPVALMYDIGNYEATLDEALKLADYAGFPARKAESERRGKLRGIGLSCYIEACGIAPSAVVGSLGAGVGLWESAKVRFTHTGKVQVMTGTHSHGQGHETTFAQVVAEKLGVPYEDIDVIHGDTDKTPVGMGTYGSRSLAVGGEAMVNACKKIVDKGKKIAAHLMEAAEADIEFKDGQFTVAGTDKSVGIGQVAFTAYVPHNYPQGVEPGLEESAFFDPPNFTYPSGTYVCELEVDPGHRRGRDPQVRRGRRFRQRGQPDDRRGPGPWRAGPGHRPGAARGRGLRRGRPAADRLVHGLHHAARRQRAELRGGDLGRHGLHRQLAGREGLRRGRGDRLAAGGDQRHHQRHRRAGRDAGDAGEGLARHPGHQARRKRPNKQGRDRPCTTSTIIGRAASRTRWPLLAANEDAKLHGRRADLPADAQAAPGPADRRDRPGRHRRAQGDQGGGRRRHHRRHDPPRRRRRLGRGQAGHPVRWPSWPS